MSNEVFTKTLVFCFFLGRTDNVAISKDCAYMIAFVQVWQGGEGWAMSDQLGIFGWKKT